MSDPRAQVWRSWLRLVLPGRNPLCRWSDRAEGLVVMVALLVVLLAVPVAASISTVTYVSASEQETARQVGSYDIVATVVAHTDSRLDSSEVRSVSRPWSTAKWQAADGSLRTGPVPVPYRVKAGEQVTVRLDATGEPVAPSPSSAELVGGAVMVGILAFGAVTIAVAGLYCLIRRSLDRRRLAAWTAEWDRVGPRWTRR